MVSSDFGMGGCEANVRDAAGPSQVEAFFLFGCGRSRGCDSLFPKVDERNPTSIDDWYMKNIPLPFFYSASIIPS